MGPVRRSSSRSARLHLSHRHPARPKPAAVKAGGSETSFYSAGNSAVGTPGPVAHNMKDDCQAMS